jgi:uncharacterized integral membrane protein
MNMIFKMLVYLALAIILVAIALANNEQLVDVHYFPGQAIVDIPVFLVILGSVFIGLALAGAVAVFEHFKHSRRERDLQRRIDTLEAEARDARDNSLRGAMTDADHGAAEALEE